MSGCALEGGVSSAGEDGLDVPCLYLVFLDIQARVSTAVVSDNRIRQEEQPASYVRLPERGAVRRGCGKRTPVATRKNNLLRRPAIRQRSVLDNRQAPVLQAVRSIAAPH